MTNDAAASERQGEPEQTLCRLTLYVSAGSELSSHAIVGAKAFCERVLPTHYDLQILDLETHAASATAQGVLATPTLVVTEPLPLRRHVGDLSNVEQVAQVLGFPLPHQCGDARSGDQPA